MVVVTFYDIPLLCVAIYHSMKRGMNLPLEKELPDHAPPKYGSYWLPTCWLASYVVL